MASVKWAILVAIGVAAFVPGAVVASGGSGKVKSGTWSGKTWVLTASDSASGSFCVALTLNGRVNSSECGNLHAPAPTGRLDSYGGQGMSYLEHDGPPSPDYIVGPVVAQARTVVLTLSNGTTIHKATIPAPPGLTSGIRFYATALPCHTRVERAVGRDQLGRTVAHLKPFPFTNQAKVMREACKFG